MTNMKIPVLGRVLAVALITWARIWPFKVPHLVAAVQVQLQTVQHVKQIEWPMGMNKNSIDWSPIAQKQFPLLPSMSQGKWKWTMIHFCHVLLAIYRTWWVKPITRRITSNSNEFTWYANRRRDHEFFHETVVCGTQETEIIKQSDGRNWLFCSQVQSESAEPSGQAADHVIITLITRPRKI